MRAKLAKRTVDSAEPGARDAFVWDTELPGFGLKVTPQGARIFVLQYWRDGRARRITLGRYGSDLTIHEARTAARRLRGRIALGGDPAGDRAKARSAPTLTDFARRYIAEHAKVRKRASTVACDERNLKNHILPQLGALRVHAVTRGDIARFHAGLRSKPIAANRCMALLSNMFSLAEYWNIRPDGSNPTRHVGKYPERAVERFLSTAELGRLGAALDQGVELGEHPSAIAAVRLLLATGCRKNEILTLKWEHVDFERGCLQLPQTKTGPRKVTLSAWAMEFLATLAIVDKNPYVLPGNVPGQHFVALDRAWQRLRHRAGLPDVRVHDLRHSYGAIGAGLGQSLLLIGKQLGHRRAATTQRYAHLDDAPVRAAADMIAGYLTAALDGRSVERTPSGALPK